MNTDRKPWFTYKHFIALIVIIPAAILIILKLILPIFSDKGENTPMSYTIETGTSGSGGGNSSDAGEDYNIRVGLSEGQAQSQTPVPVPMATYESLSPQEIETIFARLPVLPVSPGEQTEFNYPVELLPPPRPGTTVQEQFPPYEVSPTPEVGPVEPLKVLRFAPEGEIPLAPFVSITFNQSMVPLGTLSDLAAVSVPAQIDPQLPGTWRWLGTKTLTFEYDSEEIDRLPKATSYTVTIPAGTKSITGGVLEEPIKWTFETPPPKVVTLYPQNIPQPLEPLIFVSFDQRIDPGAVLKTIQLYAGNEQQKLTLATQAEIEKDKQVSQYVEDAQAGRWLVFKATQPFPADTSISITIGPGTPSAEGPLVTSSPQSFGFSTYAPLRIVDYGCNWGDSPCPPLTPFYIRFNNPLDTQAFNQEMLRVKPEIPGMSVNVYGDTIGISGETKGQTTYTITLSAKLKDIFDQTLGKDEQVSIKVGKAEPRLFSTNQVFVTLDPAQKKPVFSVYAINYNKLAVSIYAVQPSDWEAFTKYLREWQQSDRAVQVPGTLVFDKTISLELPVDTLSEVNIELEPYLKNDFGHLVVIIEPPKGMFETENEKWQRYYQTINAWVQVTQIGVDAYTDYSDMLVWATDLKDGAPLADVSIQPNKSGSRFTTGADGTVRFAIPNGALYLVASKGKDTAMLLHSTDYWESYGWGPSSPSDSLRWYVFDDRKMYQPGEEVHIKGWMRRVGGRQNGDVSLVGSEVSSVSYQLMDPQGNAIGSGQADVNALGGFDFTFTLPQVVNLGTAYLNLSAQGGLSGLDGAGYNHAFQIQEFRRPEFEVSARSETAGPYFAGGNALLVVEAKYYAGGALPDADVTWEVRTSPGIYTPPNWPDFVFGEWHPWWWDYYRYDDLGTDSETKIETFAGKTDESGKHYLQLDFSQQGKPDENPQPLSVVAQATVMDVNRQAWASTTTLLVHPADLYVGLHSERYFVDKGTPLKVDFIVTDLDGNPVADRSVVITAARLEWKLLDGTWGEEEVDLQKCTKASKLEPDSCAFETPIGGSYRITAVVTDEQGRLNQTRFTRWVSGGQQPPARNVEQEEVTLIPDKQTYQPGDTAQILVQSPFTPAQGLLTVSRSGFLYTTRFYIGDGSTTLNIPIKTEFIPNLNIQVDLVGSAPRTSDTGETLTGLEPRPAFATAQLKSQHPSIATHVVTASESGGNSARTGR